MVHVLFLRDASVNSIASLSRMGEAVPMLS